MKKKIGEQAHDQEYGDPILLKKKLFRFHYCASFCLSNQLNDHNKILADLQNFEVEISYEDKAFLLLT